MKKVVVGIDIGLDGGLSVLDLESGKLLEVQAMPSKTIQVVARRKSRKLSGKQKVLDLEKLEEYLTKLNKKYQVVHVAIEEPIKRTSSFLSMRSLAMGYGQLTSMMFMLRVPHSPVWPKVWQDEILGKFPRGQSKVWAERKARQLEPEFQWEIQKTPRSKLSVHDGVIDAYLIARWYRDTQLFS